MDDEKTSIGEIIVKSNQLVQAKMPLSRIEHRILSALISQIEKSDEKFGTQRLKIKDLMEASDVRSQNLYSMAEEICKSLLGKTLEVKTKEDGKRVYDGINLMNRCRYKEGDGYIEARFNEEMKPYLLQLKRRFTVYKAGHFLPLRSTHSMRIYELLKMREGIAILRISVEELRDILGLESKYSRFSDFKRSVIIKAQGEIQQKTNISFTYNVERKGQTPERIKFFIHRPDDPKDQPASRPEMEDRTNAPNIDAIDLFMRELSQGEIDRVDQETLNALYRKAKAEARRNEPDAKPVRLESETYRIMTGLWDEGDH